ncbi:PQQ-binding-like beta-propeller repeat protein [Nannocystis sp. SCPEA4]|uniref:outer membrane protein assembly factor BamB family protein n=1 Tax=Nannocystis sp. SCPEA4 TaxID=2996787 RepID=UPI00226FE8BF|nr:PQQ-binding-like beta-propeller repeat protein [Nannocystis sp. SCPEA4]MCY1054204.1 PQQ-binding-like beta-propeller repeat protein [Nannocystis sp. SCPEA4]
MRPAFIALACPLVVAACTPLRPPTPDRPSPALASGEPVPEARPSALASPAADLWRWDRGDGKWGDSLAKRQTLTTDQGTDELRYLAPAPAGESQKDGRFGIVHLDPDGKLLWQAELGKHFVGSGAMVRAGELVYATHHSAISSGASVSAIDAATGQVRWTVALAGLGPVSHSQYLNETEIELDARGLVIYGNETQGAYTEVLDPATGKQLGLSRPDPRFVGLTWEGKSPGEPFAAPGPAELAVGSTRYVFTEPAGLARIDGRETVWTLPLRDRGSCNHATMRVVGDELWIARYCAFASGVELFAVDAASGTRVREVAVRGLGSVDHSEYYNEVALDVLHGHLVVRGREAAGCYIEIVDPVVGASRVSLTF